MKCKRDCVTTHTKCVECYHCEALLHKECLETIDKHNAYFCSDKCMTKVMPFTNSSFDELVTYEILFPSNTSTELDISEIENDDTSETRNNTQFVSIDHYLNINCSYLNPNQLHEGLVNSGSDGISIFHNNIRSLSANFDKINEIFSNSSKLPDILAFSETKLNETKNYPDMRGFSFESKDSLTNCGGVGMYISDSLEYTLRPDLCLETDSCEDLWVQLNGNENISHGKVKNKLVVGVIYRHPRQNYKKFCEKLCRTVSILNKTDTKYVIVGDVNIDVLKYNLATNITEYVNSLYSLGCKSFIDKPTRITSSTSSCIDHVYSNFDHDQIESYIIESDASDHFSTLTTVSNFDLNDKDADVYIRKTNLSPTEWQMLNDELEDILDIEVSCMNTQIIDVDQYATKISDTYQYLLDKYMPLTKLTRKEISFHKKPWISEALKNSIRRKNELYELSKFKNSPELWLEYSQYRNLLTKLLRKAKDKYYIDKFILYGQDKAKTWQLVNEITNRKRKLNQNIQKKC